MAEGNDVACPWGIFQINFGDINTFRQSSEWEHRRRNPGAEPREPSRDENRKGRKGWSLGNGVFIKKGDEAANQLPDVEEKLGNSVLFMATMM